MSKLRSLGFVKNFDSLMDLTENFKGHRGRKGKRGGSLPRSAGPGTTNVGITKMAGTTAPAGHSRTERGKFTRSGSGAKAPAKYDTSSKSKPYTPKPTDDINKLSKADYETWRKKKMSDRSFSDAADEHFDKISGTRNAASKGGSGYKSDSAPPTKAPTTSKKYDTSSKSKAPVTKKPAAAGKKSSSSGVEAIKTAMQNAAKKPGTKKSTTPARRTGKVKTTMSQQARPISKLDYEDDKDIAWSFVDIADAHGSLRLKKSIAYCLDDANFHDLALNLPLSWHMTDGQRSKPGYKKSLNPGYAHTDARWSTALVRSAGAALEAIGAKSAAKELAQAVLDYDKDKPDFMDDDTLAWAKKTTKPRRRRRRKSTGSGS